MERENHGALTFLGVVTILYGLAYALLGTLSLLGIIVGVLPGHEEQKILIVVLSYLITIIALIGGTTSIKGSYQNTKKISIILIIIGLISLICNKLTQNMFNSFDCIAIVLGIGIFYLAVSAEKRQQEIIKAKKEIEKKKKQKTKTVQKETKKKSNKKVTTKKEK